MREAQLKALADLQEQSETGLSVEDRSARNELQRDMAAQSQAEQKSILSNMAQRGALDSGAQLAAQLSSQQAGAQRGAEAADRLASDASSGRKQALAQASNLAGNMEGAQFGRQAQQAQARDIINKFNVSNRQNVQAQNLASRQAMENQRAATANQQQMHNKALQQQQFQNQMTKASGQTGQMQAQAGQLAQTGAGKQQAAAGGLGDIANLASAGAALYTASDKRVKENIQPASHELQNLLDKLTASKYNYKAGKDLPEGEQVGVMAQDLEKSPLGAQFVEEAEDGTKMVNYGAMGSTQMAALADKVKGNSMVDLKSLLGMLKAKQPDRNVIGGDADLAAQAMSLEDEEARTAAQDAIVPTVDSAEPQKLKQDIVNKELNSEVASPNAAADSGLEQPQPKSLQDLMSSYLGGREGHAAELKTARDSDAKMNAALGMGQALANLGQSHIGARSGHTTKTKFDKPGIDTSSRIKDDRSTELKELLTAKKLQDVLKDDKGLSEYQKATLGLKGRALDLKEKAAEGKGKTAKTTSVFNKEKMKAFGKGAAEFYQMTRPQLLANLPKIDSAIELLGKDKDLTGGLVNRSIGDVALKLRDPKAYIVQQSMQSAITDTLRPTLGAQFTEKEGERIMNLTFDPAVSTTENAKRAKALQKVIRDKVKFSEDLYAHLDEHGDDKGFDYKSYGMTKGTEEAKDAPAGQVRRKMKDGRIAIFDEATKDFIKYE